MSSIARRYNVPADVLARANGLSDIHRMWAGQVLKIPREIHSRAAAPSRPATYRVRAGDTLPDIAARNKITVDALLLANNLEPPDRAVLGQVLRVPPPPSSAAPVQTKATLSPGIRPRNAQEPEGTGLGAKTFEEGLLAQGEEVASFGRVSSDEGVNLRTAPGGAILKQLPFNSRLFVSHRLSSDWYFVTLDDGNFGFVHADRVRTHPPEPGALLHKIKKGESALRIVKQHYNADAITWGQDERYYVNVLVEANASKKPTGIYKPSVNSDWSETRTREDFLIWVPTLQFARSLKEKVPSGSISRTVWEAAKSTASTVEDFYLAYAAFVAGLLQGALESLWDLLTGLIDLIRLVWDILKSVFLGKLFSDLKGLWSLVRSLTAAQLIDAGLEAFRTRWNAPDFLSRWRFRGWVVGYALAEIAMAVISGSASLVKWAGKAGKFSKLIARFPSVLELAKRVTATSKRIPEDVLGRLRRVVARTSKEAHPPKKSHAPWTGVKYADDVDPGDATLYAKIRDAVADTLDMARNLKVEQGVLDKVKDHLFYRLHELPVGPNKTIKAHFSPDPDIADLWTKATKGTLPVDEAKRLLRLIAHEYVESHLMDKGLPYRSSHPDAYKLGYNMPTPKHHGAHDLAPLVDAAREPFGHWEKMLGRKPPSFEFASDLSNLDALVELIWKGAKK